MNKRILSIITSASLIACAISLGIYSAPSVVETTDSVLEQYIPDNEENKEAVYENDTVVLSGPSPVLTSDSVTESNTDFGTQPFWEGAVLMTELSGAGTEESPYLIGTAEQLKFMANNVNSGLGSRAHYKLTSDIDLGGAEWIPIGRYNETSTYNISFCGVFDGDGHTVSNFKITNDDTVYVGFFGLVANGTIKNLNIDNAQINVSSTRTQKTYVGALAGRIVLTAPGEYASVTNCNVTGSSVSLSNNGTIYAGGISGSVISGDFTGASILIAFSNVECDINVSTGAKNQPEDDIHVVTAGGIVGYLSADTNTKITVINSSSNGNIRTDATSTIVARPLCGGAFGNVKTYDASTGGTILISSCYSQGTTVAESDFYNYVAGGFAAQLYATKNLILKDCYSSSDVNGRFIQAGSGCNQDPSAGGFVGQIFFPYYSQSYGQTIINCYASGDVAELTHTETTPKDYSFVGGFTGYSSAEIIFENCYRFEAQNVVGSDILEGDYTGLYALSHEDSRLPEKYVGFDMENIWEMDSEAEYFYPTLMEKAGYANFVSEDTSFEVIVFGNNSTITAPEDTPKKSSTIDKQFSFSHWSLTQNGLPFDFENTALSENTTFYAVFSSSPRPYTITFMNGDSAFVEQQIAYNSAVTAPSEIPHKPDTERYYYTFMYWSDTENGEKYDFTDCTVVGNMTFYAVFEATDKTAWVGGVADSFSSGFGTETLPYVISSGEEFALFAKVINEQKEGYTDAYYALGANIHLGSNYWVPVGESEETPFNGHFDGKGYTVANFKLAQSKYTGLFGYVSNATIKNLAVTNFVIDLAPSSTAEDDTIYVGALAGYITASRGASTVSGISVSQGTININGKIDRVYAGNIAGYAHTDIIGETNIIDSFAVNDITVVNSTGYSYVGGIVGQLYTGYSSLSQIVHCYSIGTINSTSYHSSRAGGLVGYLYSYGSAYTPSPGGSTSSEPGDDDDSSADLMSGDVDIMISDSFAITSVYSLSSAYNARAGRITGECNTHAGVENAFSPRGAGVIIEATALNTKKEATVDTSGSSTELSNLKSITYLSESRGFDFENVWTFISDFDYPVLKCMIFDKPMLKLVGTDLKDGTLDITLQVMSNEKSYTVMIGIYNQRNQLIKLERIPFNDTTSMTRFKVSYDGMDNANTLVVSAYESSSLAPLFDAVEYVI
ncbi:MAG: InlB B-repeat-containing protein [Clostridia bacterium]|nr:InlB B-repeat-containing protein [Clostridia bacterium]